MLFPWNYRKQIDQANEELRQLRNELRDTEATANHLRHLLDLKNEECDQLTASIAQLREKAEYADTLEEKIYEFDALTDKFAALKKKLERKIEKLRIERDEARAMIAARDNIPQKADTIDFLDRSAIQLPDPDPDHPKSTKSSGSKPNPSQSSRTTEPADPTDWYIPPSEL